MISIANFNLWRLCNLFMGSLFFVRGYLLLYSDPDWWLWLPGYGTAGFLSLNVSLSPSVVHELHWRYLCSCVVIIGGAYLLYNVWMLQHIATILAYHTDLIEARECGFLAFMITWVTVCRLHSETKIGILSTLRSMLLASVAIVCITVVLWSVCFHPSSSYIPYCTILMDTACRSN